MAAVRVTVASLWARPMVEVEEEACDDAWSNEPRRRGKMHTHHHEASHRCRYNNKSAMWQTCTYVWVAVVVLSVVPHTRLGQGRQERARLVGSTRVHKLWLRHLAALRAVLPPVHIHT